MPKMTIEKFKHKVDGLLNDLHDMFIDDVEFRTGILELLLEVTEPFLAKNKESQPQTTNKQSAPLSSSVNGPRCPWCNKWLRVVLEQSK